MKFEGNDMSENRENFLGGLRDGIPIGLGYFTVAFSLGIAAKVSGLNALEGFFASLFTIASAGEYAAFRVIAEKAPYIEMALVILVTNCRYLLMSCSLSQKIKSDLKWFHRFGVGFFITDEIFGISISREGFLNPCYTYGAAASSVLPWALGTSAGIIVGDILPQIIVSSLSVSLYGMFIAIIIPPAKKNKVIAFLIPVCFAFSGIFEYVPCLKFIGSGYVIVILTVLIAGICALLFPVSDTEEDPK